MLAVQQTLAKADYFQLYYDQYMPSAMGSVLNEAIAGLYAGTRHLSRSPRKLKMEPSRSLVNKYII
jgi:hypothetical protein